MKVLVVGSGGREHALAWKSAASPLVEQVYVAPGNAGTATEPGVSNIPIEPSDISSLLDFALSESIDLTIIGPEAPLVAGICDQFSDAGLACFGPSRQAAQLEGSKSFAKEFLIRHHIPTAAYESFTDSDKALSFLENCDYPIVIKADGLAAGKGVIVAKTRYAAEQAVKDMLSDNLFGAAGSRVVIEQFLQGEEVSFICMVDGLNVLPMASSQDHKAAYDGDLGPNTGGMGAFSPSPLVDDQMIDRIMELVIEPTVNGMRQDSTPFTGFLYAGLMIGESGVPNVVEFNCRFGDPEAQPVLSRLQSDLVAHCLAAVAGNLGNQIAVWDPRPCLGVVMAAAGYPGDYAKGEPIFGLDKTQPQSQVFHAGTKLNAETVVTNGGRVLCVTAMADNLANAKSIVYQRIAEIDWPGAWCRKDIGHKAIG